MRLKYSYEIIELEGKSFAVALEGSDTVVKLNRTAVAIFELLREDTDEDTIVEKLSKRFDVEKEVLASDVHSAVKMFQNKGLLE